MNKRDALKIAYPDAAKDVETWPEWIVDFYLRIAKKQNILLPTIDKE